MSKFQGTVAKALSKINGKLCEIAKILNNQEGSSGGTFEYVDSELTPICYSEFSGLGNELLQNNSFDTDLSNWSIESGNVYSSGGVMIFDTTGEVRQTLELSLVSGKTYTLDWSVTNTSGVLNYFEIYLNGEYIDGFADTPGGTYGNPYSFVATQNFTQLEVIAGPSGGTIEVDFISLKENIETRKEGTLKREFDKDGNEVISDRIFYNNNGDEFSEPNNWTEGSCSVNILEEIADSIKEDISNKCKSTIYRQFTIPANHFVELEKGIYESISIELIDSAKVSLNIDYTGDVIHTHNLIYDFEETTINSNFYIKAIDGDIILTVIACGEPAIDINPTQVDPPFFVTQVSALPGIVSVEGEELNLYFNVVNVGANSYYNEDIFLGIEVNPYFDFSNFDNTLTSLGGQSLKNRDWTYLGVDSATNKHIFRYNGSEFIAFTSSKVGFRLAVNKNGFVGNYKLEGLVTGGGSASGALGSTVIAFI